jgi:hypothetical protein
MIPGNHPVSSGIEPVRFSGELWRFGERGWGECDLLVGNPGGLNKMRMLVRVSKGDIEYKLMQMH